MADTNRILVIVPNWFGEVLFATPFLSNLRRAHPGSFIAVMGVPRASEILLENPSFDEFIIFDEEGVHKAAGERAKFIRKIRSLEFDTAFILRRSLSRTWITARAGIKRRIGFSNLKSGWLLTDRVKMPDETHKAWTYLRLLEVLGIEPEKTLYSFYPSALEREQSRELLLQNGISDGASFAIIHPGANWEHKRWPAEKFAQAADRLVSRYKFLIALTGAREDVELANQVASHMSNKPVILAGKTDIRLMAACIERSSLFISNDTGVSHIACALNRPVVALYGPTYPAFTGPLGDVSITAVIHHAACCPNIPCYEPDHPGYPGMDSISVDEVLAAAEKLLTGE